MPSVPAEVGRGVCACLIGPAPARAPARLSPPPMADAGGDSPPFLPPPPEDEPDASPPNSTAGALVLPGPPSGPAPAGALVVYGAVGEAAAGAGFVRSDTRTSAPVAHLYKPHRPFDDESSEPEEPPGSPEPAYFMVSGPGLKGGAAGRESTILITARDANRRRVLEGGDEFDVSVDVRPSLGAETKYPIAAEVQDRGDGTYVARWTVPGRGNYLIGVEVNGLPVEASPFPVFFAPPGSDDQQEEEAAMPAVMPAEGADGGAAAVVSGAAVRSAPKMIPAGTSATGGPASVALATTAATPQATAAMQQAAMVAALAAQASGSAAGLPPNAALLASKGADAHRRTIFVSNYGPGEGKADSLRQLFGVFGSIASVETTGSGEEEQVRVQPGGRGVVVCVRACLMQSAVPAHPTPLQCMHRSLLSSMWHLQTRPRRLRRMALNLGTGTSRCGCWLARSFAGGGGGGRHYGALVCKPVALHLANIHFSCIIQ